MKIPLSQFEQYINEAILKRGLAYFGKGYVTEVEEVTNGVYEAIVIGSEAYSVRLEIKNNNIIDCACSCPYDMDSVCKHVVSLLFYLQQDVLKEIVPKDFGKRKKTAGKPISRKRTSAEALHELLIEISHTELISFIQETAENDRAFRHLFLSSFAAKNEEESKELYVRQIRSILRSAGGRDGFIDWRAMKGVERQISDLIKRARKQAENKNYNSAILICSAVMEEMADALQYADDSDGGISGSVEQGFELLSFIAERKLPEETRIFLFSYCLSGYENNVYKGWDWHLGILGIASDIAKNEEIYRIIKELDKIPRSGYEFKRALEIKFDIVKRTEGQAAADQFAVQHIDHFPFRTRLIEVAIENKDYQKAIRIAKDGVEQDKRDKPGLVGDWYGWLLKIAQIQNDKKGVIEYARFLFLDHFFRDKQDYYAILKETVAPENWRFFVEKIVTDSSGNRKWVDFHFLATLFTRENWMDRLVELLKENPSFDHIASCEKSLAPDYSEELLHLYDVEIRKFAENSTGRSQYQMMCRYLRRMIKLGGREQAEKTILFLKKQYPQRRALLEELKGV